MKIIKRVNKQRYSRVIESNLMAVWDRANALDLAEGCSWYQRAHDTCQSIATRYNVSLEAVCGVMAALSPGNQWDRNVEDCRLFVSDYVAGYRGRKLPPVGSYGRRNRVKSEKILNGEAPLEVLGGDKVRNFYLNLLDPTAYSPVTIDRHMKSICMGVKLSDSATAVKPGKEYAYLARHLRNCATKVNVCPNHFQGTVWLVWRRLNAVLEQQDLFNETNVIPF